MSDKEETSRIVTYEPCVGGHTFVWPRWKIPGDRIPDGIPCQCKKTVSRWRTCPTCGQDQLMADPILFHKESPTEALESYTVKEIKAWLRRQQWNTAAFELTDSKFGIAAFTRREKNVKPSVGD